MFVYVHVCFSTRVYTYMFVCICRLAYWYVCTQYMCVHACTFLFCVYVCVCMHVSVCCVHMATIHSDITHSDPIQVKLLVIGVTLNTDNRWQSTGESVHYSSRPAGSHRQ